MAAFCTDTNKVYVLKRYPDAKAIGPDELGNIGMWRIRSGEPGFYMDLSASDERHLTENEAWATAADNLKRLDKKSKKNKDTSVSVDKKGVPLVCPHCKMEALEFGGSGFDKHIKRCGEYRKKVMEEFNQSAIQPAKPESLRIIQHGGGHYKQMAIEPAEYLHKNHFQFCEAEAIKYLSRFRNKKGAEDIKKAMHYCQMILDMEYQITATIEFKEKQDPNVESDSSGTAPVEEVSSPK